MNYAPSTIIAALKAVGSESTRVGVYLPEILAEEITKQIRGEG